MNCLFNLLLISSLRHKGRQPSILKIHSCSLSVLALFYRSGNHLLFCLREIVTGGLLVLLRRNYPRLRQLLLLQLTRVVLSTATHHLWLWLWLWLYPLSIYLHTFGQCSCKRFIFCILNILVSRVLVDPLARLCLLYVLSNLVSLLLLLGQTSSHRSLQFWVFLHAKVLVHSHVVTSRHLGLCAWKAGIHRLGVSRLLGTAQSEHAIYP